MDNIINTIKPFRSRFITIMERETKHIAISKNTKVFTIYKEGLDRALADIERTTFDNQIFNYIVGNPNALKDCAIVRIDMPKADTFVHRYVRVNIELHSWLSLDMNPYIHMECGLSDDPDEYIWANIMHDDSKDEWIACDVFIRNDRGEYCYTRTYDENEIKENINKALNLWAAMQIIFDPQSPFNDLLSDHSPCLYYCTGVTYIPTLYNANICEYKYNIDPDHIERVEEVYFQD